MTTPETNDRPRTPQQKTAVAIGVCALSGIGLVMSMQSTSLMAGTGTMWTGAGLAAAGLAAAFFLGAEKWVRVLATVALVGAVFSAGYMEKQLSDKRGEVSRMFTPISSAPTAISPPASPTAVTHAAMGTGVRDGNLEFVVNSVERAASIPDSYESAQPQGEYLIVDLTVTNVGSNTETYMSALQMLSVDRKQYESAGTPTFTLSSNATSQINPGIGIDTKIVFDVPVSAVPESIELHGEMLSPGVYVSLIGE